MSTEHEEHIKHLEQLARQAESEREYEAAEQTRLRVEAAERLRLSQVARARIEQSAGDEDYQGGGYYDKRRADANYRRAKQARNARKG